VSSRVLPRRVPGAFLVPLVALGCSAELAGRTGASYLSAAVLCTAAGAAWQLLHPRDLVDRLTHFAAAYAVVTVVLWGAVGWSKTWTLGPATGAVGLAGVLVGCVYAEQWRRSRERGRNRMPSTAPAAQTPGR